VEPKCIPSEGPSAVGHYSSGYVFHDLVYTGGAIPLDPDTGEVVGSTMAEQTTAVMKNLEATLKAAGSGLDRLLKTMVFITDMSAFEEFNTAYAAAMGTHKPARSTVQVAGLVRGIKVEIEGIGRVTE